MAARDRQKDELVRLCAVSDDFLVKPFELAELEARIGRLVRKQQPERPEGVQRNAALELNRNTRCVTCEGRTVGLTRREFALLETLMARPGTLMSRRQLEAMLYSQSETVRSNVIEFLIHSLRGKIGRDRIENVRGLGWRLTASN